MLFNASRLGPILFAAVLILHAAHAQVRSNPVHQDTGPLSDLSTNAGAGSRPVHEPGRTVSDGSLGRFGGNSVRESVTGDVRSGPVSDVSVGPVTSGQPVSGGGTMTDAAVGSVKKDTDSPLGERISQPVQDLGPLLEQLRALQPQPSEPGTEAAQALPAAEEEAVPEAEPALEPEQPADNEEPAAVEADAAAPDVAAAEAESAAPEEQPAEPAPDAEADAAPDQDNAAAPAVEDDPRDAAEPTPAPGIP